MKTDAVELSYDRSSKYQSVGVMSPVYFYAFPVDAQLVLNSFKTEMYQLLLLSYKYAHIVTV